MPGWVIQLSYRIVYCGLALAVILALACFIFEVRRRSFHWLPLYVVALALQPGWHSTALAPYFVVGAVYSGVAGVLTAMIVLRRALHLERYISHQHFDALARLLQRR